MSPMPRKSKTRPPETTWTKKEGSPPTQTFKTRGRENSDTHIVDQVRRISLKKTYWPYTEYGIFRTWYLGSESENLTEHRHICRQIAIHQYAPHRREALPECHIEVALHTSITLRPQAGVLVSGSLHPKPVSDPIGVYISIRQLDGNDKTPPCTSYITNPYYTRSPQLNADALHPPASAAPH